MQSKQLLNQMVWREAVRTMRDDRVDTLGTVFLQGFRCNRKCSTSIDHIIHKNGNLKHVGLASFLQYPGTMSTAKWRRTAPGPTDR